MSTKLSLKSASAAKKKIDSPLAKYNSAGQLFCVLCNSQVKNEMYWTGHVNGKSHREALHALKNKGSGGGTASSTVASKRSAESLRDDGLSASKRSRTEVPQNQVALMGPPKSVVAKPAATNLSTFKALEVEEDERMEVESSSKIDSDLSRIEEALKEPSEDPTAPPPPPPEPAAVTLPAGFFDDAKEDAKARGIEYRNPEEAEWERFMKEIASEEVKSSNLRTVDDEVSAKDRELDEIEEQMKNWQRVIGLEQKAKQVREQLEKEKTNKNSSKKSEDSDSEGDADFDEDLDWRSKKY